MTASASELTQAHREPTISELIRAHDAAYSTKLNLVASENLMSHSARRALQADFSHRYWIPPTGERPPEIWDYPNQALIRQMEARTRHLACELYEGDYADVRPLSGNNACYIVFKALVPSGATVFSVPASAGGHFTTDVVCRHEGIRRLDLPYRADTGELDVDALAALARRAPPRLVFLDASMVTFPYPLADIRRAVGPAAIISYDASHTFGLIGGREFQRPLAEGADLIHGSTHKSLFGPQKGMIVCRQDGEVAAAIHRTITPLFVSNAHVHHIAALGIALEETASFGGAYAKQVIANAQHLGAELAALDIDVWGRARGFTRSHQLIVKLGSRQRATRAFERLDDVGIHVNCIRIPLTDTFGLRLGLAELTRRGFVQSDISLVARLLADCIRQRRPSTAVRAAVSQLSARHTDISFAFPEDD